MDFLVIIVTAVVGVFCGYIVGSLKTEKDIAYDNLNDDLQDICDHLGCPPNENRIAFLRRNLMNG